MNKYEKTGVSNASEIKEAYDYAVEHNLEYYRAISKTGVVYGWDTTHSLLKPLGQHVKADLTNTVEIEGQKWFKNPKFIPAQTMKQPDKEKVEEVKEPEVDYKALYEEKCKELENAKQCVDYYKQENEELKDGLSAFKTLLNKF